MENNKIYGNNEVNIIYLSDSSIYDTKYYDTK